MNVRTDRQKDRQTDKPHELHVYVGLAQARPNKRPVTIRKNQPGDVVAFLYSKLLLMLIQINIQACVYSSTPRHIDKRTKNKMTMQSSAMFN